MHPRDFIPLEEDCARTNSYCAVGNEEWKTMGKAEPRARGRLLCGPRRVRWFVQNLSSFVIAATVV